MAAVSKSLNILATLLVWALTELGESVAGGSRKPAFIGLDLYGGLSKAFEVRHVDRSM